MWGPPSNLLFGTLTGWGNRSQSVFSATTGRITRRRRHGTCQFFQGTSSLDQFGVFYLQIHPELLQGCKFTRLEWKTTWNFQMGGKPRTIETAKLLGLVPCDLAVFNTWCRYLMFCSRCPYILDIQADRGTEIHSSQPLLHLWMCWMWKASMPV